MLQSLLALGRYRGLTLGNPVRLHPIGNKRHLKSLVFFKSPEVSLPSSDAVICLRSRLSSYERHAYGCHL